MKLINNTLITTCMLTIMLSGCGGGEDTSSEPLLNFTPEASNNDAGQSDSPQETLDALFEELRERHNLPAVAGVFVDEGGITQSVAVGMRTYQGAEEVTLEDSWHIGSLTKSMTATLAGRLVEADLIQWDTTVAEVFPVLAELGHAGYRDVTLKALLSHTGGMMEDISALPGWDHYFSLTSDIRNVRRDMVADILRVSPGEKGRFVYSNAGFVVAGAMLEAVTTEDWETLMQNEVFLPLGIEDAGFGAPSDELHPRGHSWEAGSWRAYGSRERYADNPKAIGPAGTVHMSLPSLAKYAQAHLSGETGQSNLLTAETFRVLHQEVAASDYALGWFLQDDSLFHDGSNNRWYAKLGISIQQGVAAISVTNAGGHGANQATDEAVNLMLQRHLSQ